MERSRIKELIRKEDADHLYWTRVAGSSEYLNSPLGKGSVNSAQELADYHRDVAGCLRGLEYALYGENS